MPSINITSSFNINNFCFTATFDPYNKRVVFDASCSSYSDMSGQGILYVQGISFYLKDEDGLILSDIDFSNTDNYIVPSVTQQLILDLTSQNFAFWFQKYEIFGAIKDQDGTIYQTVLVYKKVCQPVGFNESGYVNGMFNVQADCVNNTLSVKEVTLLVYNNQRPVSVTKSGNLYYPTGTISPVSFTGTPFYNNVVYTGEYRIKCTTVGQYDLNDGVFVNVTYYTDNVFNVTCGSKMSDLNCCIAAVQKTAIEQCQNTTGQAAKQKLNDISTYLALGISNEINGQSSQVQYDYIHKYLSCDCAGTSIQQNEQNPIGTDVYSILVVGVNGSTVTPSTNGRTQTFTVSSNIYQIVKGNTGDLAFTLQVDNTTPNVTKTIITFNYEVMASYILNAIAGNPTLANQLNSLVNIITNIDLSNLNGKCVIDLSSVNYFLSQLVPNNAATFNSIVIGSTTYTPSSPLLVSNTSGIDSYLNGLGLGTYQSSFSYGGSQGAAYFNILTIGNSFMPVSVVINVSGNNTIVNFQKSVKSLIDVLQSIINYLCGITALQVALGNNLALYQFDYNGAIVITNYTTTQSQDAYNQGISTSIANIVNRINTLTGITCSKISAIFQDYPNSSLGASGRIYGNDGTNCVSWTNKQVALSVISSINAYSDVKTAFCAIDCTAPATCPDISAISLAMSASNIGIYGLSFTITPTASQTVTVKYRVSGTSVWMVATNALLILPNGNISGTTPFVITGVSVGTTYDVQIINNCGGVGFINQITTPTGSVYALSVLIDNIIYNICGSGPVTIYASSPFGTGTTLYTDIGLTTPLTGYTLVSDANDGEIFNLNTSTGVVGSDTGSNCQNGFNGLYRLNNSSDTPICSRPLVTLYTNGGFAVGGTLFLDSSLTTPQTGYSYVVNVTNGNIYNLNDSNGIIGSITGLSCTTTVVEIDCTSSVGVSVSNVTVNAVGVTASFPVVDGEDKTGTTNQVGTYTVIVNLSTIGTGQKIKITDSNGSTQCQSLLSTTITFSGVVVNTAANIIIELGAGVC